MTSHNASICLAWHSGIAIGLFSMTYDWELLLAGLFLLLPVYVMRNNRD